MTIQAKLFIVFSIFFGICLSSCSPNPEEKVDEIFSAYNSQNFPGAAVMVIQSGTPVLTKTYGMADVEKQTPVTSQTNFRLASITKQFTAMCIMMLQEQGKLDYSTTLKTIFPEFPEYGNSITIQHLLQHTSGLIAYEDVMPDSATVQVLDRDVLHMMMQQDSTYFQPGTKYRYSNSGYAVLAMVVEKLSGQSFASFLKEHIFLPLSMNNSVAYEKGISEVSHRAMGYKVENDSVVFSDQSPTSAVLGDGGIYTSLDDLIKWDQALYTDKLVSTENMQRAFTPGLDNYGFGWRIDAYQGHQRLWHTGSTCGFRNAIQRFPDDRLTIIVLTNRADPEVASLAEKVAALYLAD